MASTRLAFLSEGRWPTCRPRATPRALAAAKPDLTRSRMRFLSNSARPAMMVRISLPLAVLRSKLRPVCARTPTLQLWRSSSVWTRSWVLRPQRDSSVDEDGLYLSRLRESHHLLAFNAIVLGARGGFLEDTDDFVASAPGKCAEI